MWKLAVLSVILFFLLFTKAAPQPDDLDDNTKNRVNCIKKCSGFGVEPKFDENTGACTCVVLQNFNAEKTAPAQKNVQPLNFPHKPAEQSSNNLRRRRYISSNGNSKRLSYSPEEADPIVGQSPIANTNNLLNRNTALFDMSNLRNRLRELQRQTASRAAGARAGTRDIAAQADNIRAQMRSLTQRLNSQPIAAQAAQRARQALDRSRARSRQALQRFNTLTIQSAATAQQRGRGGGLVGAAADGSLTTGPPQKGNQKTNGQSDDSTQGVNSDHSIITQPKETIEN